VKLEKVEKEIMLTSPMPGVKRVAATPEHDYMVRPGDQTVKARPGFGNSYGAPEEECGYPGLLQVYR